MKQNFQMKINLIQNGMNLRIIRNWIDLYCARHGIARHKTNPYTPQQNGVAERMNRTLLDKVRSMLATSGISKDFWAESMHTAAYLVNRCPSTALGLKTPLEAWNGFKPDLSNLRSLAE